MPSDAQHEIYRQRYETYRHLDKLRWQMLQIAIVTASALLAFGKTDAASPAWWVVGAVGLVLLIVGGVMERIRAGIASNAEILRVAAESLGDSGIPPRLPWWRTASFWIATTLMGLGLVAIAVAAWQIPSANGGVECTESSSATTTRTTSTTKNFFSP